MRRVLIVTSMYLPYLAADAHRARLLAGTLPKEGWDVELLVPGNAFQRSEHFEPNATYLSADVPVHRVEPQWGSVFHVVRSRSLGWRAYRPLQQLGNRLLSQQRFDLVYFSCSQPTLFHLGVGWAQRFGIPFVLDFHDPWYIPIPTKIRHLASLKRRLNNGIAGFMEAVTLKAASGLVAVSPEYLGRLNRRYSGRNWMALRPTHQAMIPFAASEDDFRAAARLSAAGPTADPPGTKTIVYTGAGGPIMEDSLRTVCRLLGELRKQAPARLADIRIRLFGTEPLAGGQPALTRVIAEEGLADICCEHPARLSYLESVRRIKDADGLLILGVNDTAYSPSKLSLYELSGKPILACMRKDSVVSKYFNEIQEWGRLIQFEAQGRAPNDLQTVIAFLEDVARQQKVDRRPVLADWLAPAMARRHAALFNACVERPN